jgi:tetratricopeptide (TPR) repeat protein
MEFTEAIQKVIHYLQNNGKIQNSDLLTVLEEDINLYTKVREHVLSMDDVYDDNKNGLIFKKRSDLFPKKEVSKEETNFPQISEKKIDIPVSNLMSSNIHIIFISYGRDDAQEFAKKLYNDLKQDQSVRDIWIDFEKIGLNHWDRKIEEGIEKSTVFLALISPYAIRDQSICRDEVLYAINVGKTIVPLLIQLKTKNVVPLLLCRRNWIDFSGEDNYPESLIKLKKFLSGDDTVLNPPSLPIIVGTIPLDFSPEIARYSHDFTGRDWLMEEVDKWIHHNTKRAFIVVGDPGVGKSAIAAKLSQIYQDQVLGIHFCTRKNPRSLNPLELVANLIAQLNNQLNEYAAIIGNKSPERPYTDAALAFRELIIEPVLRIKSIPSIPYLIILDSLDEAYQQKGYSIVDLLFDQMLDLPPWIRIIATTRPEVPIIDKFGTGMVRFDLISNQSKNLSDIGLYLDSKLRESSISRELEINKIDKNELKRNLAKNASGNFLYAVLMLKAIEDGEINLQGNDKLPLDLIDYFSSSFKRKYQDLASYRPLKDILEIILTAYEPLNSAQIGKFLGINTTEIEKTLAHVNSFFPLLEDKKYQSFHNSIIEWLKGEVGKDPTFRISTYEGQKRITETCWNEYHHGIGNMGLYCTTYLPLHLLEIKRYQDLADLLINPQYFIKVWEKNQFLIKSWWSSIESVSPIRMTEVYKDIITHPANYPIYFVSYVANLLSDSGYPLYTEPIHNHFISYYRWRFDEANLQTAYGNLGCTLLLKGELKKALALFEKQERICRKIKQKEGLLLALGNKGTVLYKMNYLDSALKCYKEQEKLCEDLNDLLNLQICLGNQGNIFFEFEDFDTAAILYSRQKAICKDISNVQGECNALGNQGNICFKFGDIEEALKKYKESESLSRKILYMDGIQRSLGDQGKLFYVQEMYEKALLLFEEQEDMCSKMGNIRSLCESLRAKAQVFEALFQFNDAETIYYKIVTLYEKSGDQYGYLNTIDCLGLLYYQSGDFQKALEFFEKEEDLSRREQMPRTLQQAIIHEGILLEAQGKFKSALTSYQEAEKISLSIGDQYGVQYALNNQAAISVMQGEIDKAVILYKKMNEICKKTKNYYGLQYSLSSLSFLNENNGNYLEAIDLCHEHINACKKIFKYYDIQRSLGTLGSLYCKMGNYENAEKYLEEQFLICTNHEYIHEAAHSRIHLSIVKYNLGKQTEAINHWQEAIVLLRRANPRRWLLHASLNFGIIFEHNEDICRLLNTVTFQDQLNRSINPNKGPEDLYIKSVKISLKDLIPYYQQCEELCQRTGFVFGTQLFLALKGSLYIIQGDLETAFSILHTYQEICRKINFLKGLELSYGFLAEAYYLVGEMDSAINELDTRKKFSAEKHFFEDVLESNIDRSMMLLIKGDLQASLQSLEECDELYKKTPDFTSMSRICLLKGIIYTKKKQYEKALHCFDYLENQYPRIQEYSGVQIIKKYQRFIKQML